MYITGVQGKALYVYVKRANYYSLGFSSGTYVYGDLGILVAMGPGAIVSDSRVEEISRKDDWVA